MLLLGAGCRAAGCCCCVEDAAAAAAACKMLLLLLRAASSTTLPVPPIPPEADPDPGPRLRDRGFKHRLTRATVLLDWLQAQAYKTLGRQRDPCVIVPHRARLASSCRAGHDDARARRDICASATTSAGRSA
jgi:hypothetical protein